MSQAARSRRHLAAALLAGLAVATAWLVAGLSLGAPPASGVTAPSKGYWLGASDGGIFGFGDAGFYGSTGALTLNKPIVGMAATRTGKGYWEVASDGGMFNFGDAGFFGSTGAITLNKPIVGMAASPSGKGYWLVASDGGIFGFGDAGFFGSTGALTLNKPIVGMAATPSGKGYWLVASDGGIFGFGDAAFHGSTGAIVLAKPIVGMAATPSGKGYWLVASDGGIFGFGDAKFLGSTGALKLNMPVVAMAASPTGQGYWLVASDGGIFNFGDAAFFGSTGAIRLNRPIVGIAPGPGVPETVVDTTKPGVTVKQAATQADPTKTSPVSFTVTFSEPVTGFTSADVTLGGTAGGTKTATVTGSGASYTVAVSGMTTPGTVTVSVAAGVAGDAAGNLNTAATNIDNSVTYDATAPTVTVNQAADQFDPGKGSAVNFTVVFSEAVTGFSSADVAVSGTAGGTKTVAVTGAGATYNVAVGGMTTNGTVTASVVAGAASDAAGNTSGASTSTDDTVTWDGTAPTVTIDQAGAQADPTGTSPVNFTVVFSEAVTGFTAGDVTVTGSAGGTKTPTVTGSGATYNVAVSGMTTDGTVVASLAAGAAADAAGNASSASTSTDSTVSWDAAVPTVTVNQAVGQADPDNTPPVNFTVVFSESVTGFAGADVAFTGSTAGGTLAAAVTGGPTTYNVAVTGMTTAGTVVASVGAGAATDVAANTNSASTSTDNTVTWDATAPTVANVTSSTANGTYRAGDTISVQVSLSEAVVVDTGGGTPTLALDSGGSASYTSGSGTSTLTFTYTVGASQNTADLDYAATGSLALAGGTIRDTAGNDAVLTLPVPGGAGSLGANKNFVVDTTAPTVTGVTSGTPDGSYNAGDAISIQVSLSEAVTVGTGGGTPTLALNSGGSASYTSGSGTSTLTFTSTVAGGENAADLDYAATGSLALAGGTIRDAAGNDAVLTLATPGAAGSLGANKNIVVDTTAPTVTGVTSGTADGSYNAGDTISIQVSLSEAVAVTGTPTLALNSGGSASYASGSGTSTLTFTYTVAGGENAADLDHAATGSLALAGGTIRDAAGNAAVLTLPAPGGAGSLGANKNIVVDTTAPTVTGVTSGTADGAYNAGDAISIQVSLSEAVVVDTGGGTPTLALNSGGSATYTSGSGTSTLTFTYTVGASDTAADLDYVATNSLALAGGAVADVAGNAAVLTLPAPGGAGSLGANKAIVVDTTAPTVTGVTSSTADGAYNAGDAISIQVSLTEAVVVDTGGGTPTLALNSGGSATYTSGSGTSTLTFTSTVAGGENSADLDYVATGSLALAGGAIADAAGNAAVLTLPAPGGAGSLGANKAIVVDTTDPVFQSIAATMASTTVTATFSEPVDCATVASGDFLATVGGVPTAVSSAGCTGGADATVDLTLGAAPLGGQAVIVSLTGTVLDVAGNAAAPVARNTTATTDVTVTIDQAAGQVDPDGTGPIDFTVVFSENVVGFDGADVTLGGTAGGTLAANVTGGPATYNVAVTGMTTSGTVTASIPAAAAADGDGNLSAASTSTDDTVTWDVTAPTVTVNQAGGQVDPDNTSPINFTVVFSEGVTGFADADVSFTGSTAGGTLAGAVTGGPSTYNVAVTGMTTSGTVVVAVPAAAAQDAANNGNTVSTSTDNTVVWDVTAPTVTVNQAGGQADPTNAAPVNFTVVFSETVTGFTGADVAFTGSSAGGTLAAAVTGGPTTYNVAVTGMTTDGSVVASLDAGAATDEAGNTSAASTSTDNTVTWDTTSPTVTVEQKVGQVDPDNTPPVEFTVTFSEAVTGFTGADVAFTGSTAGGTLAAAVTGAGTTYNVAVTGMTTPGNVVATVGAGAAVDAAGNGNQASTSADNTVAWDDTDPTVTVNQAGGQADPTNASPINFTVAFSENVTGFDAGDVTLGGTAGATTAVVSGGPATYNVAVSGTTGDGTVTVSVGSAVALDAAGNGNAASTSTDNTVTYDTQAPALSNISVTAGSASLVATFSEPLLCSSVASTDFLAAIGGVPAGVSSVSCTGTADSTVDVTLSGAVVEGSTTTLTLTAGSVTDEATNASGALTSLVASAISLEPGSTPDGATVGLLDPVTYSVTAADTDGTITSIDALLDGTGVVVSTSCTGIGTNTATCDFDPTLLLGPHTLTFTAVDDDGNVTRTTRTVTVSI